MKKMERRREQTLNLRMSCRLEMKLLPCLLFSVEEFGRDMNCVGHSFVSHLRHLTCSVLVLQAYL